MGNLKKRPTKAAQPFDLIPKLWPGQTVAIVATGPSLSRADVDALEAAAVPTIAINDAYRMAPFAGVLYACDGAWWQYHTEALKFPGQRWTQNKGKPHNWPSIAASLGLSVVRSLSEPGLSTDPGRIHTGSNSAYQALNFAVLAGASRVLLLGVDLRKHKGKSHFFGDHPKPLNRHSPYTKFLQAFEGAAPQLKELGVDVVNCSLISALECFPKMTLQKALSL